MKRSKSNGYGPNPLAPFRDRVVEVGGHMANGPWHDLFTRVMGRVDEARLEALRSKYDIAAMIEQRPASPVKYFDVPHYTEVAIRHAEQLQLDQSAALRILDIGAGAGCFAVCCEELGHSVVASDVIQPGLFNAVYADICSAFGIERYPCEVKRTEPLPISDRFDLVTANAIAFGAEWSEADWLILVRDIKSRILLPSGKIRFTFNPKHQMDAIFAAFAEDRDATIETGRRRILWQT